MRFGRIKLVNYIGIYNGLGLNEIDIDFTKCKHNKVIIKGRNGSGKSTLLTSLSPIPDKNNMFIPGLPASKYIEILDNDILYQINFIHGIKNNGDRETTKAYINKVILSNGDVQQLNPNGNVSSYNDIIYSELGLDSNFSTLSRLGSENKGLAHKTPSERKKFVSSIISSLDVYNDIHKSITKKSNTCSSMIKTLTSKINNIGDAESLKSSLANIDNRLKSLNTQKDNLINEYSSFKSKVEILDPNGSIQNTYNDIYSNLISINKKLTSVNDTIFNLENKLNPKQLKDWDFMNVLNENKELIKSTSISIQVLENDIQSLLLERDEQCKNINKKNEKLNSLQMDKNYRDLELAIKDCKQRIEEYKNIFKGLDIDNLNLSTNEFILGLSSLLEIKNIIDSFNSNIQDRDILIMAINYMNSNSYPDIEDIKSKLESSKNILEQKKIDLNKYNTLLQIKQKLSLKPSNCNIKTCAFIRDAIEADNQNPEQNISLLVKEIEQLELDINDYEYNISRYNEVIIVINQLNKICSDIIKYSNIFNKLPINNIFSNKDNLLQMILDGYPFNEITTLYKYIDYSNIIDEYKIEKEKLYKYEIDYKIYESKNEIINDILYEMDDLNNKLNIIRNKIDKSNNELLILKTNLSNYNEIQIQLDNYILYIDNRNELIREKNELISQYNKIKSDIQTIKDCISNLDLYSKKIEDINKEIEPLVKDKETINHGLIMLQEYLNEIKVYKDKYEKIEIIKRYSSPNKGIQTLFIEMYMHTTLSLANQLIEIIFGGDYILLPYIINDNEFRIPIGRYGLKNDDISSLSTAEVSMISMILSFVLFKQSSTRYNIPSLDEIDGGLDNHNRIKFDSLIDQIMNILNMEQILMISHNNELNMDNCDVIILKTYDDDEYTQGNIIYKY